MSSHKFTNDRNLKILLGLAGQPGNGESIKTSNVPLDFIANLAITATKRTLSSVDCAAIHRKIGTHVTKVKSLTLDSWTKEQVERMKEMGNLNSNAIYNPNELRHPPPPMLTEDERDSELEKYIRAKYEYKKFFDKHALVASKLGPSRSTSSVSPQKATPASATSAANSSRPSTAAALPPSSAPMTQTRSFSQPAPSPIPPASTQSASRQQQQQPQQLVPASTSANGTSVWNDLVSLQTPSANSSLPLQYQPPMSASSGSANHFGVTTSATSSPMLTGVSNMNGAGMPMNGMGYNLAIPNTGMGTGPNGLTINAGLPMGTAIGPAYNSPFPSGIPSTNPFQQTQLSATNPFTQQQPMSANYPPSALSSVPAGLSTPFMVQQQQPYYSQPSPMMQMQSLQSPAPMFSPSPQISNLNPQQSQLQFANSMHYGGHSPQPQMPTAPQPPMSATPQLQGQFMSSSPQLQMGMGAGMSIGAPPPQQTQMFSTNGSWGQQQQQPAMFATHGQAQQWGVM
ncbi:putative GTPase activating protein for Arf-domain-containing protein [Lentinula boryana]|uniref:GTPase activating protein for Arf-domain-containing protein n=1 Tax=Lentinula boryana TaxID=40481 RepID=A0ABQ8Q1Z7_9AGAR|nr:putative GTPase activating protein for Arf-domain-containing protein [Lentinula boryana]